jgi:glycine dehydrogenase subunit 2
MTINPSGWRPSVPSDVNGNAPATTTGNRALMLEEALLFEIGSRDQTGVDFTPVESAGTARLGGLTRSSLDLPGLANPRPSATTPASAARITRSILASSRSDRAP